MMSYEDYFEDWLKVLDITELNRIIQKLEIEYNNKIIYPSKANVFKSFELCHLKDLKAVFLGMDPYSDGRATGVLFGNNTSVKEENLSPSLKVIKEAVINFEIPHNLITFDNSLESWAKQGILMINSALTCERGRTGSHMLMWRPFIAKLLKNLSSYEPGIVYVLFGSQAQSFIYHINKMNSHIIEIEHPAYFARTHTKMPYDLFNNINNKIERITGTPIVWYQEEKY